MKPILLLNNLHRWQLTKAAGKRSPPIAAINPQSLTGTFFEMSLPCSGQRRNLMIIVCSCCMIVVSYRSSVVCSRRMFVCFLTTLNLATIWYTGVIMTSKLRPRRHDMSINVFCLLERWWTHAASCRRYRRDCCCRQNVTALAVIGWF